MLDWQVSYYLYNMYHSYVIEAKNYFEAHKKVLDSIPKTSQNIFRCLKIERHYLDWN